MRRLQEMDLRLRHLSQQYVMEITMKLHDWSSRGSTYRDHRRIKIKVSVRVWTTYQIRADAAFLSLKLCEKLQETATFHSLSCSSQMVRNYMKLVTVILA